MKDLATIDAHSDAMAGTIHNSVSDRIKGSVIKKSVCSLFRVIKQTLATFPHATIEDEEFAAFLFNMSERRVEANAGDAVGAGLR